MMRSFKRLSASLFFRKKRTFEITLVGTLSENVQSVILKKLQLHSHIISVNWEAEGVGEITLRTRKTKESLGQSLGTLEKIDSNVRVGIETIGVKDDTRNHPKICCHAAE